MKNYEFFTFLMWILNPDEEFSISTTKKKGSSDHKIWSLKVLFWSLKIISDQIIVVAHWLLIHRWWSSPVTNNVWSLYINLSPTNIWSVIGSNPSSWWRWRKRHPATKKFLVTGTLDIQRQRFGHSWVWEKVFQRPTSSRW